MQKIISLLQQPENAAFIERMHGQFQQDPLSVDSSWRYFFEGMQAAQEILDLDPSSDVAQKIVDRYRRYGYFGAKINPLNEKDSTPEELEFQLSPEKLKLEVPSYDFFPAKTTSLGNLLQALKDTYCGTKTISYMGMRSQEFEEWIQTQIEPSRFSLPLSLEEKKRILNQLERAELFEIFLHTKYVGQKRFSLEGSETLIPLLSALIEYGSDEKADEFVIGMSHRGRLNVLSNILNKTYSTIFSEFEDYLSEEGMEGSGDVKYHRGFSSTIQTSKGKSVHLSLTANPSHLESVDPVALGKTKAKQIQRQDHNQEKVIPILIHGDAAFAGQGVVYETAQLYQLEGYSTGGTLHIIVNNHIGFTTLPNEYMSSKFCSDLGKTFGFPTLHLNAEDPEGAVMCAKLAMAMRLKFRCDVIIELHCYRKYGHNEGDEPAFTQPLLYNRIRNKQSIRELYRSQLIGEGISEKELALDEEVRFKQALHYELEELKLKKVASTIEAFSGVWQEFRKVDIQELMQPVKTGVSLERIKTLGEKLSFVPETLNLHPKLLKVIEERAKMAKGERPIDWAMAELLSFATLLIEKVPVRLSGQDCQRGTFTQRHAVWVDQTSGKPYFPLQHMDQSQASFNVYNSTLSEYAILGFEYGYSLAFPSSLVLWEAQFGDFANGAQVIFDQYIVASAQKWKRYSGIVVLLPHGYEGQGPEHSSARFERFLQLAAESNIQVVNPTTPVQYFHLLRRQMLRKIRIPLIVLTPKGLLRHPSCVSTLKELTEDSFQEFLADEKNKNQATRCIFCSGRIYYDLIREKETRNADHITIIRIEQIYPFHQNMLKNILDQYTKLTEFLWVQEEPRNMGAFFFLKPHLESIIGGELQFVGREASASTASGSHRQHQREQQYIIERAFSKR